MAKRNPHLVSGQVHVIETLIELAAQASDIAEAVTQELGDEWVAELTPERVWQDACREVATSCYPDSRDDASVEHVQACRSLLYNILVGHAASFARLNAK